MGRRSPGNSEEQESHKSSAALRVVRFYKDVLIMAALVVAKMPAAYLLAAGTSRVAAARRTGAICMKQDLLEETIRHWQVMWHSTPKAV